MNLKYAILDAIKRGKTLFQLSEELGMSRPTLRKHAQKYGKSFPSFGYCRRVNTKRFLGKRFGKLLVVSFAGIIRGKRCRESVWGCRCQCGKEININSRRLDSHSRYGVKSCGCCSPSQRIGEKHPQWKGYKELPYDLWGNIKRGANRRRLSFQITPSYVYNLFLKQNKRCALSGLPISFVSGRREIPKRRNRTASLDRIDSNRGYVKGNVQWVHKDINFMKHQLTQQKFIELCNQVTQNLK